MDSTNLCRTGPTCFDGVSGESSKSVPYYLLRAMEIDLLHRAGFTYTNFRMHLEQQINRQKLQKWDDQSIERHH